jgi:ABC-type branched-subunit amino acid transport system permease subunit
MGGIPTVSGTIVSSVIFSTVKEYLTDSLTKRKKKKMANISVVTSTAFFWPGVACASVCEETSLEEKGY